MGFQNELVEKSKLIIQQKGENNMFMEIGVASQRIWPSEFKAGVLSIFGYHSVSVSWKEK